VLGGRSVGSGSVQCWCWLTGVGSLGRLHDFICEVLCGILSTVVNWVNR
jgi:hypothetical protein